MVRQGFEPVTLVLYCSIYYVHYPILPVDYTGQEAIPPAFHPSLVQPKGSSEDGGLGCPQLILETFLKVCQDVWKWEFLDLHKGEDSTYF